MKLRYLLMMALPVLFMAGCDDDDNEGGSTPPVVTTVSVKKVTYDSAVFVGEISGSIGERGVVYSTQPQPTVSATKIASGKGSGEYTIELNGLAAGTTYYVKAYGINSAGNVYYGEQQSFRTYAHGEPILDEVTVSALQPFSAALTSALIADGGVKITEAGICYSTESEPTVSNNKVPKEVKGVAAFTAEVEGLSDYTEYFARSYAITEADTVYYSKETEFFTPGASPSMSDPEIDNILDTSFEASAVITPVGKLDVKTCGFRYSQLKNPQTALEKSTAYSENIKLTIDGLEQGSTYYVWTFTTTDAGIFFSEPAQVQTSSRAPISSTGTATDIYKYKATITGSSIVSYGTMNDPVIEAGICFSTVNQVPTLDDNVITQSTTAIGTMDDIELSIVAPGATVYVRAYATNSYGTGYGEMLEFSTVPEYRILMPNGGSAPSSPYFNGLRNYYRGTDNGGSGTITENTGEWQKAQYDALDASLAGTGRQFDYHVFIFTSNSDGPTAEGSEDYVNIRYYYKSSNFTYYAAINAKISVDDQGLYTFYDLNYTGNSDYLTLMDYTDVALILNRLADYYASHKFMLELWSNDSLDDYQLIPVDDPDKYMTLSRVRYIGVAYLSAW